MLQEPSSCERVNEKARISSWVATLKGWTMKKKLDC